MLSKSIVSRIRSLEYKKFRSKYQCFVAEGRKICLELLNSGFSFNQIYTTAEFYEENKLALARFDAIIVLITNEEMQRMTHLRTASPILCELKLPVLSPSSVVKSGWTMMLDGIQDPGNLGTLIRTADWFGMKQIICSPTCADVFGSKVIQASMGAFAHLPVYYMDLQSYLESNNLPVFAADLSGEYIYQIKFPTSGILVLGNEGSGISSSINQFISSRINIPQSPSAKSESLNVAVAAGICCAIINIK